MALKPHLDLAPMAMSSGSRPRGTRSCRRHQGGWTLAEFLVAQALALWVVGGVLLLGGGLSAHVRWQSARLAAAGDLAQVSSLMRHTLMALDGPHEGLADVPVRLLSWCEHGFAGTEPVCRMAGASSASGAAPALPLAALELRHGVRWSPWRDGDGRVRDILGQEVMPAGPHPWTGLIRTRWQFQQDPESRQPALYARGEGQWAQAQPVVTGVSLLRLEWWLDDGGGGTRPGWQRCQVLGLRSARAVSMADGAADGGSRGARARRAWAVRWWLAGTVPAWPGTTATAAAAQVPRHRQMTLLPQAMEVLNGQCEPVGE